MSSIQSREIITSEQFQLLLQNHLNQINELQKSTADKSDQVMKSLIQFIEQNKCFHNAESHRLVIKTLTTVDTQLLNQWKSQLSLIVSKSLSLNYRNKLKSLRLLQQEKNCDRYKNQEDYRLFINQSIDLSEKAISEIKADISSLFRPSMDENDKTL